MKIFLFLSKLGSGCRIKNSVLYMFSYRDPNFEKTIDEYCKAIKKISVGEFVYILSIYYIFII